MSERVVPFPPRRRPARSDVRDAPLTDQQVAILFGLIDPMPRKDR